MNEIEYCCENCFNTKKYPEILEELKKFKHEEGICPTCENDSEFITQSVNLNSLFENLLKYYEEAEDGTHFIKDLGEDMESAGANTLGDLIQNDFDIFNDKIFSKANRLLDAIRDIHNVRHSDEYIHTSDSCDWISIYKAFHYTPEKEFWELFCNYIKHHRRFLINWIHLHFSPIDIFDRTHSALENKHRLYRARIVDPQDPKCHKDKHGNVTAWRPDEMLCPQPPIVPSQGRCNPTGIPYLYLADTIDTTLKEIRAQPGDLVTIATVEVLCKSGQEGRLVPLDIADLTKRRIKYVSPFEKNSGYENSLAKFVKCLNESMGKPIDDKDCNIEYIPTQIFTEAARDLNFDGIKFSSTRNLNGTNYVLFPNENNVPLEYTYYSHSHTFPVAVRECQLVKVSNDYSPINIGAKIDNSAYVDLIHEIKSYGGESENISMLRTLLDSEYRKMYYSF